MQDPDGNLPPKVTYQQERLRNATLFTLAREDHTLGNMLRMQLHRDDDVVFAGYKVPHPLDRTVELRIQTTNESTPMQAYNRAINDLDKELDHLKTSVEEEIAAKRAQEP